jgi:hypothetical protein
MIVTVDVGCIFEGGNPEGQLINYARPFLNAFKDVGYQVVIVTESLDSSKLEERLTRELIPYNSIDRFPYEPNNVVWYHGLIQIKQVEDKPFTWLEVKDKLKGIIRLDYQHFNVRYMARVMNEPYFTSQERENIINELSQA